MSIAREDGRMQICCDSCPASYPNTYAAEDFDVMVADARTAGWTIRKAPVDPGRDRDTSDLFGSKPRLARPEPRRQTYTHTCPSCAAGQGEAGDLL